MKRIAATIFCCCLLASRFALASANVESYQYTPDTTSYTGTVSGTVTVMVNLTENITSGTSLLVGDSGLNSAGAKVTRTSGSATLLSFSGGSDWATFTPSINGQGTVGSFNEIPTISSSGPQGSVISGGRQELLAILTIQLPNSPGISTFNLGSIGAAGTTLTYKKGFDLDSNGTSQTANNGSVYSWTGATSNGATSFTVTTNAPEPGSIALFGASALGLLLRRRRSIISA